jgi:hypothetical protein
MTLNLGLRNSYFKKKTHINQKCSTNVFVQKERENERSNFASIDTFSQFLCLFQEKKTVSFTQISPYFKIFLLHVVIHKLEKRIIFCV